MENIRIIRVFSKALEKRDFPGIELNSDVFPRLGSSAQCEQRHNMFSLHHIIRRNNPKIREQEKKFERLHLEGKIPSNEDFHTHRKLVSAEEEKALKHGMNIILCTCNEAGSHRITNSIEPKYCIIDECAMATEPECMVPIRRAQHVVLIGDHQQLQPVIQSKEAEKMGLGKSLFERYAPKAKMHLLEIQYRMVSY